MRQMRIGLGWVFMIRGDDCWIVLAYWLDSIISDGLYCIGWIVSRNTGFYELAGYWLNGTEGTDGLDGTFVGQGWGGRTLEGAGTGAPPLAPERERHHWLLRGGRLWLVVAGTNCVSAARAQSICVGSAK